MGRADAILLTADLTVRGSLTQINLSHNGLCGVWEELSICGVWPTRKGTYTSEGIKAIAHAIGISRSLTQIDLSDNQLRVEGGKAIAAGLAVSPWSLTQINLSGNQLCGLNFHGNGTYTAEGIKAIADAIRVSRSLTQVLAFYRYFLAAAPLLRACILVLRTD
eukprot:5644841-Prymnesium_polylepis.1